MKALENPVYQKNKLYIDGIQELNAIDGYRITLVEDDSGDDIEEICDSSQAKIKG
tara:strand:+ start:389 stop:553 length:165 start_codon:yes stop_codon:yes gene_type:complete